MNYSWHGVKPPTTDVTIGVLWEREDSHHHVFVSRADAPLSSPVHLATAAQNLAKPSMASRSRVEDV